MFSTTMIKIYETVNQPPIKCFFLIKSCHNYAVPSQQQKHDETDHLSNPTWVQVSERFYVKKQVV